jgi:hypothetical protein
MTRGGIVLGELHLIRRSYRPGNAEVLRRDCSDIPVAV